MEIRPGLQKWFAALGGPPKKGGVSLTQVILVILIYFVLMLGVGLLFKEKAQNLTGYFLSSRSLPTPVVIFTFAATWIGASATLGKSGLAYSTGLPAISSTIGSFGAFFIFTFFAGRINRIGQKYDISSIPNLFYKRFGKSTSIIAAAIIGWTMIGTVGTQMIGSSKMLEFIFQPYGISYETALIISVIVVVIYTAISGMYGVAYTDVIQGIILLVVIGAIIPAVSLQKAGGWETLQATLPASYFTLDLDISLIGYLITSFLYFVAGPPYWQRAFAAKDHKTAQLGALGGNVIIVIYTLMVILIGICAAIIYPNVAPANQEMIILLMVRDYFPTILYALTAAALLSVIMSTTDSYLILASQTITADVIQPLFHINDTRKLIRISKLSVAVVGVFSLIFALMMTNVFQAMMLSMTCFAASAAIPALAAIFSKKVTTQGMNAAMLSGLVSAILWGSVLNTPYGISESIAGSVVSLIVIILVSAATQGRKSAPFLD